jgi:hypothetical protein
MGIITAILLTVMKIEGAGFKYPQRDSGRMLSVVKLEGAGLNEVLAERFGADTYSYMLSVVKLEGVGCYEESADRPGWINIDILRKVVKLAGAEFNKVSVERFGVDPVKLERIHLSETGKNVFTFSEKLSKILLL